MTTSSPNSEALALPPLPSFLDKSSDSLKRDFTQYGRQCWDAAISADRATHAANQVPAGWTRSAIFQAARSCAAHAFDLMTNSSAQKFWQGHADNLNAIVDAIDAAAPSATDQVAPEAAEVGQVEVEPVIRAARELVECKDLKEQIEAFNPDFDSTDSWRSLIAEYERRKEPAWAALRAALAATPASPQAPAPQAEAPHCANCGIDEAIIEGDYPDEERFCSVACREQHDELGCPSEGSHSGFRHPEESARLIACENVLRNLASYLGTGGYNAPTVDPAVFEEKIRWGIDHLHAPPSATAQAAPQAPAASERGETCSLCHGMGVMNAKRGCPKCGKTHDQWRAEGHGAAQPESSLLADAMRWLNQIEFAQGGSNGPTVRLRAALSAIANSPQAPAPQAVVGEASEELTSPLAQRVIDLHDKASMPWNQAEELALSEFGFDEDDLRELIGEFDQCLECLVSRDEIEDFARHVLVFGPDHLPKAPLSEIFAGRHAIAALTSPAPSAAPHQGADALREALRQSDSVLRVIAEQDPIENCLDPQWAARIAKSARAALAQHQAPQQGEQL